MTLPDTLPAAPERLPAPVVDNHTHLLSTTRFSGLEAAASLDAAAAVGVIGVVDVGYDVESSVVAAELAGADPRVRAAVAVHPNDAARAVERGGYEQLDADIARIAELIDRPGVVAVGETGIDHYRTRDPELQRAQVHSFRAHIALAREHDLTLVIHDRDAHDEVLAVLDAVERPERVVMHCFSGDARFAEQCVERGFWLSFPGVVTFGSAESLRQAARVTPVERILVETDAPYLTPKPHRGRPNAPYLLPHTVRFLAELLDHDLTALCQRVTANTEAAYATTWGSDA
ncbi:TatD family hydrolase [Arachnia propionica]|uniref:TatD family deoxyribonuclease n=1 Tax=Arachnia propionica TaxID=1750 RepID=A0A3P1WTY3_9ACTN|nr:TatD family hydrolase [Arachnia propionica]RRD49466.1 TatD family deoxyribonuclease [Arachnia propionica]